MKWLRFRRGRGFSLVEVMVALAVLAIVVLGVEAMLIHQIRFSKVNTLREEALFKASKVLENLMSKDFTDACLSLGSHSCADDGGACCLEYAGDSSLSWEVTTDADSTKKIAVTAIFSFRSYQGEIGISSLKGDWQ
ncbi:hypothetical protein DRN93_02660 [archaeon]|nr:MAG: hypothetical protein DRN93_02660 [archaeon]